jgi:hypothetical protein
MKAARNKYDIVFPRMACTMMISVYSDDDDDVPTLSGRLVMFLPFKYCNWHECILSFPHAN